MNYPAQNTAAYLYITPYGLWDVPISLGYKAKILCTQTKSPELVERIKVLCYNIKRVFMCKTYIKYHIYLEDVFHGAYFKEQYSRKHMGA